MLSIVSRICRSKNNFQCRLAWPSSSRSKQHPFCFADEYLEEEYVDLDSESEPGEESMASLPLEVIPTKDAKAEVGTTSTNDDEDDDGGYEGSGSNEAGRPRPP